MARALTLGLGDGRGKAQAGHRVSLLHGFRNRTTSLLRKSRGVRWAPSMAKDMMVYNITPDGTKVRQVINTQDTWPHGEHSGKVGTIIGDGPPMSTWLREAAVSFPGIDEYPDVPHFQG